MIDAPRRIASDGEVEIDAKKSRFICTLVRVESEDAAREVIASIRKAHWQANHHCSAWIIGDRGELQRSNDDGEPAGTAGTPMLEVLRRQRLTDVVAVVTRYFGGTLLGAGGLIRAYGGAVSAAVRQVGIVERRLLRLTAFEIDHAAAGRVHNALIASPYPQATVDYGANGVTFELHLESGQIDPFATWLAEQTNGTAHILDRGDLPIDVPVAFPEDVP
jgi:uncharacterized YigZ family protein